MFKLPPITTNPQNKERKAGFEIEFTGIRPIEAADAIVKLFNGNIKEISEYEVVVLDTAYGKFSIYLDSVYLRSSTKEYLFRDNSFLKEFVYSLSELVVPYEIVTPPINFSKLDDIEKLRSELKSRGALGTSASILYAFGMHINIETFSYEAKDLLNILRAFVLMQEWIKDKIDVDLTRKLSWFIEPFDKEFINFILKKEYNPTIDELIDDYIFYNPTRNRALDMLPLFCYIKPDTIKKLPPQKISPRPAFHYRLPNSKIDEESWSIAQEFNIWSLVEKASLSKELYELIDDYFEFEASPFWFLTELWVKRVDEWVKEL